MFILVLGPGAGVCRPTIIADSLMASSKGSSAFVIIILVVVVYVNYFLLNFVIH